MVIFPVLLMHALALLAWWRDHTLIMGRLGHGLGTHTTHWLLRRLLRRVGGIHFVTIVAALVRAAHMGLLSCVLLGNILLALVLNTVAGTRLPTILGWVLLAGILLILLAVTLVLIALWTTVLGRILLAGILLVLLSVALVLVLALAAIVLLLFEHLVFKLGLEDQMTS